MMPRSFRVEIRKPVIAPELEDQKRPEGFAVVLLSRLMLGDAAGDLIRMKDPLLFETLAAQKVVHQGGQGPAQPVRDRDAKALFGTSQDRGWQPPRGGPLEQSLGPVPAEFEGRG